MKGLKKHVWRSAIASLILSVAISSHALASRGDYFKGVNAYRDGDYLKAMVAFERVLDMQPDNVNAHYYSALAKEHLGRAQDALQDYRYVSEHGREDKVVAYAQERLSALSSPDGLKAKITALSNGTVSGLPLTLPAPAMAHGDAKMVQLKPSRNALILNARLVNQYRHTEGDLIVDTGATYTSISKEMAETLGLDMVNCPKVTITTANGRIEVPKVTIETLNVNGLEAHNVEATVIPVHPGSSFSGLLGLSFLKQFIVTIDVQAGSLTFTAR
jgi:clan AA aspartic protease (TIGR02281 family)